MSVLTRIWRAGITGKVLLVVLGLGLLGATMEMAGGNPTPVQDTVQASRNNSVQAAFITTEIPSTATDRPTMQPRPTKTPEPTQVPPTPTLDPMVVVARDINIRKGPSVAFDVQTILPAQSTIRMISKQTFEGELWYEMYWNGSRGWVSSSVVAAPEDLVAMMPTNSTRFEKPTPVPQPTAVPQPAAAPAPAGNCHPSYPDVCIPGGPDLDCPDIPHRWFRVVGNDPHRFDGDNDGYGCES